MDVQWDFFHLIHKTWHQNPLLRPDTEEIVQILLDIIYRYELSCFFHESKWSSILPLLWAYSCNQVDFEEEQEHIEELVDNDNDNDNEKEKKVCNVHETIQKQPFIGLSPGEFYESGKDALIKGNNVEAIHYFLRYRTFILNPSLFSSPSYHFNLRNPKQDRHLFYLFIARQRQIEEIKSQNNLENLENFKNEYEILWQDWKKLYGTEIPS